MNKPTVLGLLTGLAFVFYGILSGGSIMNFIDLPSVYIVFGGTAGAMILGSQSESLRNFFKIIRLAFTDNKAEATETIKSILELSYIARKEGLLSLEYKAEKLEDPFLKKGIELAIDGMASEVIRDILEAEISAMEQRHKENRSVLDLGGVMSPAFGMIGTLIGLINMLKYLDTPDKIGPQMGIALITTFYGSMLSNLFFIPLSQKLKAKTEYEVKIKEIIIEGILAIQSGENTRFIEQRLLAYLQPDQKKLMVKGENNEKAQKS